MSQMQAQPAELKLADERPACADVIRMERRHEVRRGLSGHVTALQTQGLAGLDQYRICSLQLVNISDSGLGAVAQESIPEGARIAVFFPPHGPDRGLDLYGKVVRCHANGQGHQIGIRFERRPAA